MKNNAWTRAFLDADRMLMALIGVNVAMYVLSLLFNPGSTGLSINPLSFLSPDNRSLLLLGATGTIPIVRFHRWWTLLSANYLHGSILHLIFNMIALKQIGPFIIQEYGSYRTLVLYTLGGVFGYLVSFLFGVPFTIGASAAVCSLIGAALYYGKSRGGSYGQAVTSQIGGWAVGIFVFGFLVPGINNWGHGGGMLAGILLGFLLGYNERRPENLMAKIIALICVVCTALVLIWAVFTGFYISMAGE